ncbi:hypothetical protein PilKf_02513 [Pillotina sp. SPG140]|jgi:drug/metabolite transporter (DMT)-like permease
MKISTLPQLSIVLCAILWSTSGLFIKLLDWNPILIASARSFIAASFMFLVRCIIKPPRTRIKNRYTFCAAALSYAVTMVSFVIANKLTASANAIVLQYTAPVWAALFGIVLIHEKPRIEQWIAMAIVLLGLIVFFRGGFRAGSFIGDCIAVFSGICFGAHSVFMRTQKEAHPPDALLFSHCITAVIGIPFIFLSAPDVNISTISAITFMGIVQIGCASLLFSYGIKTCSAVHAMLIALIEPMLNPLWVFIITGEQPSHSAFIGGVIIICAISVSEIIGILRKRK